MRNRIKVPVKPLKSLTGSPLGVIDFHSNRSPRRGVFICEVFRSHGVVANAYEPVLRGFGSIRLYLQWPGYTATAYQATIHCAQLTKAELARKICDSIAQLLQKCLTQPVSSNYAEWRVGPDAIRVEDVVLVSIFEVGEGTWQAQLELEIR
ncbi:hypothetical protein A7U60_g6089 [Sanghuangporus baumii]|uniref:Uncharacterized protein n=1 Tax=Sanghuangporus baumii TaxID=108892 RepID=A0A9Q5HW16_SANBA|nr:hypothetical protein A7U60_g6089 [Sanghuangporus baumii]